VLVVWPVLGLLSYSYHCVCLPEREKGGADELVAVKPRKFALAFTLGSLLFMLGFAILHGPWNRKLNLSRIVAGKLT
jgi:hypothetical protein